MALLAKRVEARADDAEVFGADDRAEATGYFLLHFWHAHGALGNVVDERYSMVADEQQEGIGVQAKALQQIVRNRLFDASAFADPLVGFGIELLAFIDDGIVERPEGGDICGPKFDIVFSGRFAQLIGSEQKFRHRLRPFLPGDFFDVQQFAQEVSVAQSMRSIVEFPIRRLAIMNQHTHALGQNPVRLDCFQTTLGVQAVPRQFLAGCDVQPMQLAGNAQARFVGIDQRAAPQQVGDQIGRALQCNARFIDPRHQRAGRYRQAVQVLNQFGGARIRQHLSLNQMDGQRAYVRAVLDRLVHADLEVAHMNLATGADHFQRAMFDDSKAHRGHVEHLTALRNLGLVQRQRIMATLALFWQRMIQSLGRLSGLLERRSFVSRLSAGRLAGCFAQRAGLLGQAIRRRRQTGIVTGLAHLRFERIQTRQQRQDKGVLLLVGEARKIGLRWFLCHGFHDGPLRNCLQPFYCGHCR